MGTSKLEALARFLEEHRQQIMAEAGIPGAGDWWEGAGPEEIRSGAITEDGTQPGKWRIEANTARGVRRFLSAEETTGEDAQSAGRVEQSGSPWSFSVSRRSPVLSPPSFLAAWRGTSLGSRPTEPERLERDDLKGEPALKPVPGRSPEEVIEILKGGNLSPEERRTLIVEAEVIDFGAGQVDELNSLLRSFIEHYRDSARPDDLVAVASAIRKYVSTMRMGDLASVAILLDAGHNGSAPLEIEVEVAKMLVRKLTANPPGTADPEPELADRLMEIARTYLSPRLLSRDKYGAVAMNAVLALLLLRSRHVAELIQILARLDVRWFRQLLGRRVQRTREAFQRRFPEGDTERYLGCLNAMHRDVAVPDA